MTNFEKFKDEILRISNAGQDIAVKNGIPCNCDKIPCKECDFSVSRCVNETVKWLYAEYKEPAPKLTAKERVFCEAIDNNGNTNICRNEDGNLCVEWNGRKVWLDSSLFPFIERKTGRSVVGLLMLEVE